MFSDVIFQGVKNVTVAKMQSSDDKLCYLSSLLHFPIEAIHPS